MANLHDFTPFESKNFVFHRERFNSQKVSFARQLMDLLAHENFPISQMFFHNNKMPILSPILLFPCVRCKETV